MCSERTSEVFVECFVQTIQRRTALNREAPEHRNLFVSAIVGNFLQSIKRQIQNSVVEWASQTVIMVNESSHPVEDDLQECKRKQKLK